MKTKIFFVALVFCVCRCSPNGDGLVSEVIVNGNKMYVVSLNDLKADTVTIYLSSVVENLELVHLETKEEAYFKPWYTTVTEKYIGVRQPDGSPYMLFDRSGKFLCTVGSRGRGPGEYILSSYDDIIDDKNELIYLAPIMGDKILVYNTSGKFLKDIVAPHRLIKAKIFLSDNVLTVVHMPFQDHKVAFQFDVNTGEVLKELSAPTHLIVQNFDGEIFNTKNVSGIFDFLCTASDTLYHFDTKNDKMLPFFLMTYNSSGKPPYKQHHHLNKDIIITFVYGKGLVATDLKNKMSSWFVSKNDFCGNIRTSLGIRNVRNGYFVHNLQPEELMEMIENRLAERSCTEQDRQILNQTLSTLKENANNVVFIGKLKKEVKSKLW